MAIDASASLQALTAISTATQATAHNIANVNTDGYAPQSVRLTASVAGGGPQATVQTSAPAPATRADASMPKTGTVQQGSGVNVAAEMTSLIQNEDLYAANAAVIRTAEETSGTVLDMKV